jgi:hypothetical protein
MGIERELQKTRDGDEDEVKGMREGRTGRQERSTQDKTRQDKTLTDIILLFIS